MAVNRLITSSSHNSRRQFALVEQRSDAFSGVYPLDGGSKEWRDGELGNIAEPLFRWEMHSVRDHDRFDLRCAQQLDGGAAQYPMHCACVDGPHARLLERLDSGDQRTAGGNLVLEDYRVAVLYIANHLALLNLRIVDPAFVDNR